MYANMCKFYVIYLTWNKKYVPGLEGVTSLNAQVWEGVIENTWVKQEGKTCEYAYIGEYNHVQTILYVIMSYYTGVNLLHCLKWTFPCMQQKLYIRYI